MDDFIVGPQIDEYTWWDYELEFGDDDFPYEDDEVTLSNDQLATSTNR